MAKSVDSRVPKPSPPVPAEHGATTATVHQAVDRAAPAGAGAAADRHTLAPLGIDIERLLSHSHTRLLDRPPAREPLLPLRDQGTATMRPDESTPSDWTPKQPTKHPYDSRSPVVNANTARNT